MKKEANPKVVFGVLVLVQILFGINYVVSKVVVLALPPLIWASSRAIVIATIMLFLAGLLRRPQPDWTPRVIGRLVLLSLFGIVINQSLFLTGLRLTTSTNSAILCTLIPVFTLLIVTVRGQEKVTKEKLLGFLVAFFGVLVLFHIENFQLKHQTAKGDLFIVLNALSFAIFLSLGRKMFRDFDGLWMTGLLFLFGSLGLFILSIPEWMVFNPPQFTHTLISCIIYATLGGTLLTYFLNLWALGHTHASKVALFVYVQPLVATGLGVVFLGETLTGRILFSALLIFGGVYLVISRRLRWFKINLDEKRKRRISTNASKAA